MSTQGTHFKGPLSLKSNQSISGPGALNTEYSNVLITTTGADAFTLADAPTNGQEIYILMVVDGGDATITPANLRGGTTITLDAVGDAVTLVFIDGSWSVKGGNGAAIA